MPWSVLDRDRPAVPAGAVASQPTLDDVGLPLREVTFVVVDLETTGGSPASSEITEIGAVKVRGGEVLAEFQTLVDPGVPVPAQITLLTGITTAMVHGAPTIAQVLPSFLEFIGGCVLVAHNARFDVGFLKAAAARHGYPWPAVQVVDTVALARRVVTRDEAPNHKLGTLAALFCTTVSPDHRALNDARATVDVLHAVLGRLATMGVTNAEDLATAGDAVPAATRRKHRLADHLPDGPGVYLFRGPRSEVLYVGTSTVSVRSRVRSYFTAAEKRRRMAEMVTIATSVTAVPCATALEARVRELRLIAEHTPPYNRRSTRPERMPWVRLTVEPFPRLSVVYDPGPGFAHLGPFPSRAQAQLAVEAVHEAVALRQCSGRLPATPGPRATACVLAELGRCGAPCVGGQDAPAYAELTELARRAIAEDAAPVVRALASRISALSTAQRYEEAGVVRDRLAAFLRGAAAAQRLLPMARCAEIVAARRSGQRWEVVLVRHGRLAGTALAASGHDVPTVVTALLATGEHVAPPEHGLAAHPEEAALVADWLDGEGVRLVQTTAPRACPIGGAQRYRGAGGEPVLHMHQCAHV